MKQAKAFIKKAVSEGWCKSDGIVQNKGKFSLLLVSKSELFDEIIGKGEI